MLAIVMEVIIIVMYGIFVRAISSGSSSYYPDYQDVNVMILIGFGFLMTFIKAHNFSALSYTFFINAIVVQLAILLQEFWKDVFLSTWD